MHVQLISTLLLDDTTIDKPALTRPMFTKNDIKIYDWRAASVDSEDLSLKYPDHCR